VIRHFQERMPHGLLARVSESEVSRSQLHSPFAYRGCEGPKGEPGAVGAGWSKRRTRSCGSCGTSWPTGSSGRGRSSWPSRCCRERHSSCTPRLHGRSAQRGACDRVLRSAQKSCDLNQRKNSRLSKARGFQPSARRCRHRKSPARDADPMSSPKMVTPTHSSTAGP